MNRPKPIEYADAASQVRAVFDDIKRSRKVDNVNNFRKYLVDEPTFMLLRRRLKIHADCCRSGPKLWQI